MAEWLITGVWAPQQPAAVAETVQLREALSSQGGKKIGRNSILISLKIG